MKRLTNREFPSKIADRGVVCVKRKFFLILLLWIAASVWARERVCFGVFLNEEFAVLLADTLEKNGIPSDILLKEQYSGSTYLYVVSRDIYEEPDQIRKRIADLENTEIIGNLNLGPLTAVQIDNPVFLARNGAEPVGEADTEKQISAREADKNRFPLTPETPYSVFLERYKEEIQAEKAQIQLKEKEIESYIVKKYDEETLLSFDLHSGAFASENEAEAYCEKLETKGVVSKGVHHLDEFREQTEDFDRLTDEQEVVHFVEHSGIPEELSPVILEQLNYFPIHSDYSLTSLELFDIDNISQISYSVDSGKIREMMSHLDRIGLRNACSFAVYENPLFGRKILVTIFSGKEPVSEPLSFEKDSQSPVLFRGDYGHLEFYRNSETDLVGISVDRKHLFYLSAESFSEEEWEDFINRAWEGGDRFVYPEIRKTLFILPKTKAEDRKFLSFSLKRVEIDYAEERGNAVWAKQIVGHWDASCLYDIRGAMTGISFFNLDYELNAEKVHSLFMEEHRKDVLNWGWDISEEKQVNERTGWFLENDECNELSFSFKPYIIAVGSGRQGAMIDYSEILQLVRDLQIWENRQ